MSDARIILVFSDDAAEHLRMFCARFPTACHANVPYFEVTSLARLVDASIAWSSRRCLKPMRRPLACGNENRSFLLRDDRPSKEALRLAAALLQMDAKKWKVEGTWRGGKNSLELPSSFFLAAMKKILGTAHTHCQRVWVVDSEA
eukprot:4822608-Prymnesium_polylepis.1